MTESNYITVRQAEKDNGIFRSRIMQMVKTGKVDSCYDITNPKQLLVNASQLPKVDRFALDTYSRAYLRILGFTPALTKLFIETVKPDVNGKVYSSEAVIQFLERLDPNYMSSASMINARDEILRRLHNV